MLSNEPNEIDFRKTYTQQGSQRISHEHIGFISRNLVLLAQCLKLPAAEGVIVHAYQLKIQQT